MTAEPGPPPNGSSLAGGRKKPKTAGMRWVLAALPPADRRALVTETLAPWVVWLVGTYQLRTQIPACWYRHPDVVERLKNLMVAWIRIFAEATTDRPLALVEFDDALERELRRLHIPDRCLDGEHETPPGDWHTDTELAAWLDTATWATADAAHPTPGFAPKGHGRKDTGRSGGPDAVDASGTDAMIMSRAEAERLTAAGKAHALRDFAIHYDDSWWVGDEHLFARVTDDSLAETLDEQARKLTAADQAVARAEAASSDTGRDP